VSSNSISVIKVRDLLMVTMPADPDESTVSELQDPVLDAIERHDPKGFVLDISAVDT
jgi:rsbT antagonist protein RsbS